MIKYMISLMFILAACGSYPTEKSYQEAIHECEEDMCESIYGCDAGVIQKCEEEIQKEGK